MVRRSIGELCAGCGKDDWFTVDHVNAWFCVNCKANYRGGSDPRANRYSNGPVGGNATLPTGGV